MASFLSGLGASFTWDISTHYGPGGDPSYPDPEAFIAASNGIGFGIQSLSIEDPITAGIGAYPTTREDWADNFATFSTDPVHHLQLNAPGSKYWWAGYGITDITVSSGTATVNCTSDCSPFSGGYIYITGVTGNPLFNGTWLVTCSPCSSGQLQFQTSISSPTVLGGYVWSPNYWPVTIPFASSNGATSLELWECDLDYAFNTTTTTPGVDGGVAGCAASWGYTGQTINYKNQL
jgi:hypothetical protein